MTAKATKAKTGPGVDGGGGTGVQLASQPTGNGRVEDDLRRADTHEDVVREDERPVSPLSTA